MYFQQLKDLDTIDIGFVRRESPAGHIDEERWGGKGTLRIVQQIYFRTIRMFSNITYTVKRRLLNIYKFDFLLFSYSWEKYF